MKIIIEGTSKEIAALVLELQERQMDTCDIAEDLIYRGDLSGRLCAEDPFEGE